jgi:hypothetical protein
MKQKPLEVEPESREDVAALKKEIEELKREEALYFSEAEERGHAQVIDIQRDAEIRAFSRWTRSID